ncbi:recombinase family protein [Leadbetterella sp. DM7]|uniref:recombinase family protein n=1 Tax=Leadbetterella sp. DM7 TaxID=3235085 RepID=UPI00349E7D0F
MKEKNKIEKEILAKISSGQYRNAYLIYNRKSTDEAENQKNSIEYQIAENVRYATREYLAIAPLTITGFCTNGIISEKHSGFKEDFDVIVSDDGVVQYRIDRPKFQKVLRFASQGLIKGVICLCWDRISRNKGDDTIIRKLMNKGVDFRFVYATYDNSSSGALHMDIDGMFSQHHSRVTSEKVKLATWNNRDKGICTFLAPIGYLNTGTMDNKPFDPVRAPVIKRMFELYATGTWSIADIARYAADQALTTIPTRKKRTRAEILDETVDPKDMPMVSSPLQKSHVGRILSNPFYIGKILNSQGEYIQSISHKPLISEKLFEKVQEQLTTKKTSIHYTQKLDYPFRGVIRCSECRRVYTPYLKKGTVYYRSKCDSSCLNTFRSFNLPFMLEKIQEKLQTLYFTETEIKRIDIQVDSTLTKPKEKQQKETDQLDRKKRKIQEDLSYLESNKLALLKGGVYSPESFIEEVARLKDELLSLQTKRVLSEAEQIENLNQVKKLSELLKSLTELYGFVKTEQKEEIVRNLFSELSFSGNALKIKLKSEFECLKRRVVLSCSQEDWIPELINNENDITAAINNIENLLNNKNKDDFMK